MANIGYIQVNRHCNHGCHFCSNPSNGESITYEKGVEIIDDFIVRKYRGVIFTGGEPTLAPDLPRWIAYARSSGIESRVISNGTMCANLSYMKKLSDAGLELIHFSIHSYNPKIHDFLTDIPGSWHKLMLAIGNAIKLGVRVQINMTINHYNQSHLDTTIVFLTKQFPKIQHFVWNNLDPHMMRKTDTAISTLPDFSLFESPLRRAMQFLEDSGRTFRVERVPLCYMRGFEYASTETRKIVKNEERRIHFLDKRAVVEEKAEWFFHDRGNECKKCDLYDICAGIWMHEPSVSFAESHPGYFQNVAYKPQKISQEEKEKIIYSIIHY